MRLSFRFAVLVAAAFSLSIASAAAQVSIKTKYYDIKGKTGLELFNDMNRKGPRHGFLTKAIAQTQFKPELKGELVHAKGVCSARKLSFRLQVTYVYPRPVTKLDPALARRWKAFQAHNVAHEEMHGKIARDMVTKMNRMLRGFSLADGPSCRKTDSRLADEIRRILVAYNNYQTEFDRREHRDGGPVERSILALVGKTR